jgi:hypothetical protein
MRILGIISVALLGAAACGSDGQANQQAPAAGAAASGTPASVRVVPYETLQDLLPTLPGWTRLEPRGETDPVESVSRVTVDYEKPPSTLSFEFMDSSGRAEVLALIKEALKGENPELRPTTLAGFPAAEQWISARNRGAIHVLVAGRFMVVVTGEDMPDLQSIRDAAQKIDLQKMATLK